MASSPKCFASACAGASAANAALTLRFTDSADAVLWLSPSTSPGQVQELDELRRELQRRKPLLPVIARSDVFEEDEIDGAIIKRLCNKNTTSRTRQEADVAARAREKLIASGLDAGLLLPPVSVSAQMARMQGQGAQALEDAGFARLYAALAAMVQAALSYKRRKSLETLLHHLEENIAFPLQAEIIPALHALERAVQAGQMQLPHRQSRLVELAGRHISAGLPGLLERNAATRDIPALRRELAQLALDAFLRFAAESLPEYTIHTEAALPEIQSEGSFAYEEQAIEIDGERQVIGVGYERLHAALESAAGQGIGRLAASAIGQCRTCLEQVLDDAKRLRECIRSHWERLPNPGSRV